jgi:transposase
VWHQAGVWLKLHAVLLAELNGADKKLDWQRALIDASFAKAPEGGEDTGPNPTDRRKSGSKHHVMTDAQGILLSATTTAANVNDVTQALPVLLDMPPVGGKPGPKRELPDRLQGDRGYDSEPLRILLRWLGITPVLASRGTEHGSGLGVSRWFVERTISWLHSFGRLRRRLDRLRAMPRSLLTKSIQLRRAALTRALMTAAQKCACADHAMANVDPPIAPCLTLEELMPHPVTSQDDFTPKGYPGATSSLVTD